MKKSNQFEDMLKIGLSSTQTPSDELNENIKRQLKERNNMQEKRKFKLSTVAIAICIVTAMSATVFAAWHFLSASQVADKVGDKVLSEAFAANYDTNINQSVVSDGYNISLQGLISGKGLSSFTTDVESDKTYAVVSISKEDGTPMPSGQDSNYGEIPFNVSPLIKGQRPWSVNIATMNGSYTEIVEDGIMYRIIECDGIEMFADRGIYLGVCSAAFVNNLTYNYNEVTGEILAASNFDGVSVVFDLPIDISKADYEKAEEYLLELLGPEEPADSDVATDPTETYEPADYIEPADFSITEKSEEMVEIINVEE